jgi:hypothetical protein
VVECACVLAGTLSAETVGATRTVRADEAVTFASGRPYRCLNEADGTVEFLLPRVPSPF